MVQFCYLRLSLGTETVSCRLLLQMAWNEIEQIRPLFSSFDTMPQKIAKTLLLLVSADKMWLITSSLYRCILCMGMGIKQ